MSEQLEKAFDRVRESIEEKIEDDIKDFLGALATYALQENLSPDVTYAVSQYWIQVLVGDFHLSILAREIPGENDG